MAKGTNGAMRPRINFSKIPTVIEIPNLIEVQRRSYERFLQMDLLPSEREDGGLQAVFNSVFPITDFRGISQLDFVDYSIGNWECKCGHLVALQLKYNVTECQERGMTFAAPLKVTIRLTIYEKDSDAGQRTIRDI